MKPFFSDPNKNDTCIVFSSLNFTNHFPQFNKISYLDEFLNFEFFQAKIKDGLAYKYPMLAEEHRIDNDCSSYDELENTIPIRNKIKLQYLEQERLNGKTLENLIGNGFHISSKSNCNKRKKKKLKKKNSKKI